LVGLATMHGSLPSMPEWEADPGAAAESTVQLPERAATTAPSESPPAEADPQGPSGEPLRCVADGCIAWQAELPGVTQPLRVLAGSGSIVLFQEQTDQANGTIDAPDREDGPHGILAVVDAETGVIGWQRSMALPAAGHGTAGMAIVDDLLLVVEQPGTLRAFAHEGGTPAWALEVDGATMVGQARRIGPDLLVVVGAGEPGGVDSEAQVVALDPATGVRRWSSPPARRVVLTSAGPVLFDPFDRMRGLDPGDGSERWSEPLRAIPPALFALDDLVVLDQGGTSVIDAVDGRVVSEFAGRPASPAFPLPRHDEDGLLVLDESELGYLDGDGRRWTTEMSGCCLDASLDGDRVWILLEDGSVRELDREDGRELPLASDGTSIEADRGRAVMALAGGYLFTLDGNQRAREFSIEETRAGRTLARFGSGIPLGLSEEGVLLFVEPGEGPGSPALLSALRPPRHGTVEPAS
jgi:outer membrane protein assembly factor BamB